MGFLSGIVGSIFGGGSKTTVSQSSTNQTNIDMTSQIANVIDLSSVADAMKFVGENFESALTTSGEQTRALLAGLMAQIGVNQKAQMQTALVAAAVEKEGQEKRNELFSRGLNYLKIAGVAVAAWWIWRKMV